MLLKELKLVNFRQYRGEQVVEFSTDPEKNITVITGENSEGKTTFVHAFRWLLYDDDNFKKSTNSTHSQILNSEVSLSMQRGDTAEAEVELKLTYRGKEYSISRKQEYVSPISGEAKEKSSSVLAVMYKVGIEYRRINERDIDKINTMFPKGLANYLFFDGEKDITAGTEVEKAVNSIMGLDILANIVRHTNKSRGILEKKLVNTRGESPERLTREKDRFLSDNHEFTEKISTLNLAIDGYTASIDSLQQKEKENKMSIKLVSQLEKENKILEAQKKILDESALHAIQVEIRDLCTIFSYPLLKKSADILTAENIDNKGIPNMNADTIQFILDSGVCICGRQLDEDLEAISHIKELLDYLPPKSIGTLIGEFQNKLIDNQQKIPQIYDDVQYQYEDFVRKQSGLDDTRSRISNIESKLSKLPDVSGIEAEKQTKIKDRANTIRQRDQYSARIMVNDTEIEKLNQKLEEIAKSDEANASVSLCIEYLEKIHNKAAREYKTRSENNLDVLKKTIQDVFDSMYRGTPGERTVIVDSHYNVTLPGSKFRNLDTSEGTDVVKNFAFIATLLKMAKNASSGNDDEITSEPMPLIMDAPFSKTDALHIQNISKQIPQLSQQSIITMLDLQWKNASITMGNYVGKEYKLVQKTQTYTVIEEVNRS